MLPLSDSQCGTGSNGNEEVLTFSKAEALPSDGLMPYPGHLLERGGESADMYSVYSTPPADWADRLEGEKTFH